MEKERTPGVPLFKTGCISCTSSDGMQVYQHDEELRAHCYVCKGNFFNLDGDTLEPREEVRVSRTKTKDINWVMANSTVAAIPDRNIPLDIVKECGVRVGLDPATREIARHFYPVRKGGVITGYKVREVATKDFWTIGDCKNAELFGQSDVGSGGRMIIVTEGEIDRMAAMVMIRKRKKNYRVISLPFGANADSVKNNLQWLESFENVFLSLDQDEAGQAAEEAIAEVLPPGSLKIMRYSEKDPDEMCKAGKEAEYFNAIFSAQTVRPDGIVSVDDILDKALTPVEHGLSWPWPKLTSATYGYRRKEIYGFGAGSGCGKTEGFKEIIDHVINEHKLVAGIIFLEEPAHRTAQVLAGKKANKRFHVPGADWTVDELREGILDLKGKVYFYDHFGSKDWAHIKQQIKYMVHVLGIKDIFLDHLTALVAQESDEYKALNKIMEEMSSLVQELDCTIFYISHLRKAAGVSHEEGGHVSADQFKGSGAIVFWSNFLFGYERNQQADTDEERNTTLFRVLKDRNTGMGTGTTFELKYDHTTGRWVEAEEQIGDEDYEEIL